MKKSKMHQLSLEIAVGAFVFLVLLALGLFTILLSTENMFTPKYRTEIVFDNVMGLRDGDSVAVRGFTVGKVLRLWLGDDGVHVQLSTEQRIKPREDYEVTILQSSVLGGRYVQLFEGTEETEPLPLDTILRGTTPVDFIEELSETVQGIRSSLIDGGVLDNIQLTMSELRSAAEGLNSGKGTLGKLLKDEEAYDRMIVVVDNLKEITDKVNQGEGTLGRLMSDGTLADDMEKTAANLRDITDRLNAGEGLLGKLMSEDDTLYADLKASASAMREISERIRAGEGTLGKLATDDALFDEAKLLLQEVRAAVDDLRETAPITTFTSIFFGAF
jgi:phospholipid/cholesterol/gamma-HCH transport system substrate-binding protein